MGTVESGMYPLFEAEYGEITSVTKIRRRVHVSEYLKPSYNFV